jgi:hypothetical protein
MADMDKSAGAMPSMAASRTPPTKCPLEPVAGIAKFSICAAKTKAPITPIMGIFSLQTSFFFILTAE